MQLTIKDNIFVSIHEGEGTPCFHLISPEIELTIAIENISELNIITPSSVSWYDHLTLKYMLFDWLYKIHPTYGIQNKEAIKDIWNISNPTNKI